MMVGEGRDGGGGREGGRARERIGYIQEAIEVCGFH